MTDEERQAAQARVRAVPVGGEVDYQDLVVSARFYSTQHSFTAPDDRATCTPFHDNVRRVFVWQGSNSPWRRVE